MSLTKKDMHLRWKLSDDIVTFLYFDCHGKVLSETFVDVVGCLCFPLCEALKLIRSSKENLMMKVRTWET